jgi:hypothetical protein
MVKPASRRGSPSEYRRPTMVEMLGFRKPTPTAISASEKYMTWIA